MAQPPLSQHIRRMEAELGAPLFHRTTRRVELAPAGEALLERAKRILADLDGAVADARRAARGEHGTLAIGFTGSATYALLPAVAAAVRERLPGVHLTLHGEMFTPAQVEALVEGTIDLAILRPPVARRDSRWRSCAASRSSRSCPPATGSSTRPPSRSPTSPTSPSSPTPRASARSSTTPSSAPARPTASCPAWRSRSRRRRR